MIKLVIFDAGDLLWITANKRYEKAMDNFFEKYNIDGNLVKSRWDKIKSKVEVGKIKYKDSAKIEFKGMNLNKKILKEWIEMHMKGILIGKKLYPYVKPTLKKLKKYYKLAVLTDDYKGREQKILIYKKVGINDIFDETFSSQDICCKKPQRKAFFIVLNHFKVKPSEAVFVGHSEDEIEGARKFRIKTIAYKWDRGTKSNFYIKSFKEIPKVLERIK